MFEIRENMREEKDVNEFRHSPKTQNNGRLESEQISLSREGKDVLDS